ncbi:putative aldouronate transport system permease protein [Paenibacillus cellulosilyticus]|uniref:Putative aldouronate transport system permease protein n=1 Tax=Paenibacillus cellulosilyticus TaxID=375489 RepID=A0A2V2YR94_9BACL|nr:ABC transporter permease subunit [Paenibacillus cellulosilyticus]PWV99685.1 putative aldouronate transport system permease protein [Paenibacillus cellulosilyticus]QKS44879.1 sugar ABC transporter permease [Paenibacillus cellulosilyticus]
MKTLPSAGTTQNVDVPGLKKKQRFWAGIVREKYLLLMSIPFVLWLFVFNYLPIWGWTMAFQNYKPAKSFSEQKWVGFDQFKTLFHDHDFYLVLRNTLAMSVLGLIAGFTIPILFAILLNEVKSMPFKRVAQTITYLPHFVSWVVVAGIVTSMLSLDGVVNNLLIWLHIIHEPIQFMAKEHWFWGIVTGSDIWKETGWNAIIFLSAITGIDKELYEAAKVDGAGRFRQMWNITLPGIRSTIMVLFILSVGHLLNNGYEKQLLLGNSLVVDYSQVLDLYALNYGIKIAHFSYGTAISMFNSVVSILLLFTANGFFKKFAKESIM